MWRIFFDAINTDCQRILLLISFLPVTTGFLVLLIIRNFLSVCLYVRPPTCKLDKKWNLYSNHSNEDCYTNLHVQRFTSAILINFVVITLCLMCFTFNSAVSLVVTDIFWCDKNWLPKIDKNYISFLTVTTGFLVLLIIQRIILFVRPPTCKFSKKTKGWIVTMVTMIATRTCTCKDLRAPFWSILW